MLSQGAEAVPLPLKVGNRLEEVIRRCVTQGIIFRVLSMTRSAQGGRAGAQHPIIGFLDGMFAVALAAFRPVMLVEGLFVFAAVKQARIGRVAQAAASTHL